MTALILVVPAAAVAILAVSAVLLLAGLGAIVAHRHSRRITELAARIRVVQHINRDLRQANTYHDLQRRSVEREAETLPHRAARPDPDLGRWADQLRDDTAALDAELRRLLEP